MSFPNITPTSRTFKPGNFPVKTYRSESGQETRILYGSIRTDLKMRLTYVNIADADAEPLPSMRAAAQQVHSEKSLIVLLFAAILALNHILKGEEWISSKPQFVDVERAPDTPTSL